MPVKLVSVATNGTTNDEQKLLAELYELEHRQQQKLSDMMKIKNSEYYSAVSSEGEVQQSGVNNPSRGQGVWRGNQENTPDNKPDNKEEKRGSSRLRSHPERSNRTTASSSVASNHHNNNHISHSHNLAPQGVSKEHVDKEKKAFKPGARDVKKPSPTVTTTNNNSNHDAMEGKSRGKGKGKIYDDAASSSSTATTATTKSHTYISPAPALPSGGGGAPSGGGGFVPPHPNHHVQPYNGGGDGMDIGKNHQGLGIAEIQGLPSRGGSLGGGGGGDVVSAAAAYGCVNLLPGMAPGYLLEYQKKRRYQNTPLSFVYYSIINTSTLEILFYSLIYPVKYAI